MVELLERARAEQEELEERLDELTGDIISLEALAARLGFTL